MNMYSSLLGVVALSFIATTSQAAVYNSTLPEYNGDGSNSTVTVGAFTFLIPSTESIVSAVISGTFGNSVVPSSSVSKVFADGIQVADCPTDTSTCWTTTSLVTPWSYTFLSSDFSIFSDGLVNLTDTQTACCVVRLGATTLTITTAVPEPETYAMMLAGLSLVGFAARRRKANQV